MAVRYFLLLGGVLVGLLLPVNVCGQCINIGCCPGRDDSCSSGGCFCDEACFTQFDDCCNDFLTFCTSVDAISAFPRFGTMLGGTRVFVFGSFTGASTATCQFGNSDVFPAEIRSSTVLVCVSPPYFDDGRVPLTINVNGEISRSNFLYMRPDQVSDGVLRVNRESWDQQAQLQITWDSGLIDSTEVNFELWTYRESSPGVPNFEREFVLAEGVFNAGSGQFIRRTLALFETVQASVIRVVEILPSDAARPPVSLWSDVHVANYIFRPIFNAASLFCYAWLIEENVIGLEFLESRQACPCTLEAALIDSCRFSPDPFCNRQSSSPVNCYRKPGAFHCVRARFQSSAGGGQECCYNNTGQLLNFGANDGGGFAHRVHHSALVPFFSNFLADIVPWFLCCPLGGVQSCNGFRLVRPSQMCSGYIGPTIRWAGGDPHFLSLDLLQYTFNGLGEFLFTDINNGLFIVHLRTGVVPEGVNATIVTAIAAKHQDSDTFHMEVLPNGAVEVRILTGDESIGVDFGMNNNWKGNNLLISRESTTVVAQFSNAIALRVREEERMLIVRLLVPEALRDLPGPTKGLLGNWNGNRDDDLTDRNGIVRFMNAAEIYQFGVSWIVSEEEALFFRQPGATPPFSFPDFVPVLTPTNPQISEEELEMVCGGNELCEFDFLATGREEVAQVTMDAVVEFEEDTAEISLVEVNCPPLSNTPEREVTVLGSLIGDIAIYSCIEGYDLIGPSTTTCTANPVPGEDPFWFPSSPPTCSLNTAPPVSTCPDGWTSLGGKCYRIFSDGALSDEGFQFSADYAGRRQVCQYFQGTLAILEPDFTLNLGMWNQFFPVGTNQLFAIGLDDIGTEGEFIWLDETTPTEAFFSRWGPNQPAVSPNNEDCVFVRTSVQGLMWEDLSCNTAAQFVCQRHESRDNDACGIPGSRQQPSVGYLLGPSSASRRCVATLINAKWAVTSATCGWANRAVFGTDVYSENPSEPAQVREFVFFPHPRFDSSTGTNDVALLLLDEPVILNDTVSPICVHTSATITGSCSSSSWGSYQDIFEEILQTNTFSLTDSINCATTIDPFAVTDSGVKKCYVNQDSEQFVPCDQDTGAPFYCVESGRQTLVAVTANGFCNGDLFNRVEVGARINTNFFIASTTEKAIFDCVGHGIALTSQLCNYVIDCPAADDEIGCPAPDFGTSITIRSPKFNSAITNFVDRAWLFKTSFTNIRVTVTDFNLPPVNGSLTIGIGTDPTDPSALRNNITSTDGPLTYVSDFVWITYSKRSRGTLEGFEATVEIG